jgi:hypothetical protein
VNSGPVVIDRDGKPRHRLDVYSAVSTLLASGDRTPPVVTAPGQAVAYNQSLGNGTVPVHTGSSAGWVATKYSGAGQAKVWLDGIYQGTLDLYSASTVGQRVVTNTAHGVAGTHRITVQVVGTAGRPAVDVDSFIVLR